jgi:hypothetical protein
VFFAMIIAKNTTKKLSFLSGPLPSFTLNQANTA